MEAGTISHLQITGSNPHPVTTFAEPTVIANLGAMDPMLGAARTFNNGHLGVSNNGTGTIFQIKITNPTSSNPNFGVVSSYAWPVGRLAINDGAACIGKPTDLRSAKTAPRAVAPGGTITGQITVTNDGPADSFGFVVNDTHGPECIARAVADLCRINGADTVFIDLARRGRIPRSSRSTSH